MTGIIAPRVIGQATTRQTRQPVYNFQLRSRPWEITPFLTAPVLPGETMKNLIFQSRALTDPIKNNLIGWWKEYYFFYVKVNDLNDRDTLRPMFLSPVFDASGLHAAANTWTYHSASTIDWTARCLQRVVECYFRDEGETWNGQVITAGRPAAQLNNLGWLDSVRNEDDFEAVNVSISDIDHMGDTEIYASEVEQALAQWQMLRDANLTEMSYEEWVAQFGVSVPGIELHRPELLRYVRQWQYPSSAVDPTDGSIAAAVSWKISERASKDRLFKEPGFIFGVTVTRPKVYRQNQVSSAVDLLDDAYGWMDPATMSRLPEAAWDMRAAAAAPLTSNTDAWYWDRRDLYMHGDQFINFALTETDANIVGVPTAALVKRYAASADADELFVSASPANQVREDGTVFLSILSRLRDHTPR